MAALIGLPVPAKDDRHVLAAEIWASVGIIGMSFRKGQTCINLVHQHETRCGKFESQQLDFAIQDFTISS